MDSAEWAKGIDWFERCILGLYLAAALVVAIRKCSGECIWGRRRIEPLKQGDTNAGFSTISPEHTESIGAEIASDAARFSLPKDIAGSHLEIQLKHRIRYVVGCSVATFAFLLYKHVRRDSWSEISQQKTDWIPVHGLFLALTVVVVLFEKAQSPLLMLLQLLIDGWLCHRIALCSSGLQLLLFRPYTYVLQASLFLFGPPLWAALLNVASSTLWCITLHRVFMHGDEVQAQLAGDAPSILLAQESVVSVCLNVMGVLLVNADVKRLRDERLLQWLSGINSSILGVLEYTCDALVELDSDLTFISGETKLGTCVLRMTDGQSLKGSTFRSVLGDNEGASRFEDTLASMQQLKSHAAHMHMRGMDGNPVEVQLFVACTQDLCGNTRYLVGVQQDSRIQDQRVLAEELPKHVSVGVQSDEQFGEAGMQPSPQLLGSTVSYQSVPQKPRSPLITSRSNSTERLSRDSKFRASTPQVKVHRNFELTDDDVKSESLLGMIGMWNDLVPATACCNYHGQLRHARHVLSELQKSPCTELSTDRELWQCSQCKLMQTGDVCVWC